MRRSSIQKIGYLFIFSCAMGFLESTVVVYLREIYYPEGFRFPLKIVDSHIMASELLREAATLIMLITIGVISGRTRTERFGFFIFCFAVWDIFYYVFLLLLLDWPESLFTWDILFLIPVTWAGPVIAPLINSITMALFGIIISYLTDKNFKTRIILNEWILLIAGSVIVIISYIEEYFSYMLSRFSLTELLHFHDNDTLISYASAYIPENFLWWVFILGELLIVCGMYLFYHRNKKTLNK